MPVSRRSWVQSRTLTLFHKFFKIQLSMEFSKLKLALSDLAEMRVHRCYKLSEEGHKSSEVTRQPSYHSLVSVTVTAQQKSVMHSIKIKAVRISPSSFKNEK